MANASTGFKDIVRRMEESDVSALPVVNDQDHLVGIVSEEAHRLNRLVDDLLDFARPAQPQPQPIPLAHLLEEAVGTAALGQTSSGTPWAEGT